MTPRLSTLAFLSVLALTAAACASPSAQHGRSEIASLSARQVLVVPFNLGIRRAPELDQTTAPVASELVNALLDRGAVVDTLTDKEAQVFWVEAFEGMAPGDGFAEAAERFAQLAAEEIDFDVLLMPSLVLRGAEVKGYRANWDGVGRDLTVHGSVDDPGFFMEGVQVHGLKGLVTAASLHLLVLSPTGSVAFEGLAGLDVLQEATRNPAANAQWQLAPRKQPLRDLEHVRQGVELAFERKLPKTASSWQP